MLLKIMALREKISLLLPKSSGVLVARDQTLMAYQKSILLRDLIQA
jgi:hypothetical protein